MGNQPIGNWNPSQAYMMEMMFYEANAFNQDIKDMIQSEGIGEIYDFIEPLSYDAYNSLLLKIKSPNMANEAVTPPVVGSVNKEI